jgi:CheY-like chemotaxis protein
MNCAAPIASYAGGVEISNTSSDTPVVLWTEDDENDRFMIEIVLTRLPRPVILKFVEDGDQAWQYLSGIGKYSDRDEYPFPCAIVTDLKMPRCGGFELVERIRAEKSLAQLPILIFSASDLACDRCAAQEVGADAYITKPNGFGRWTTTILDIIEQASSPCAVPVAAGH